MALGVKARGARSVRAAVLLALTSLIGSVEVRAQGPGPGQGQGPRIQAQQGPITGKLGDVAQIKVPAGYLFIPKEGMAAWCQATQNEFNPNLIGLIRPQSGDFSIVFEYDAIGYVKDDEKSSIDADGLMASMRESEEASNQERRSRGWDTFHDTRWEIKPKYDEVTHNLVWAIRFDVENGGKREPVINHKTKLLGRQGVTEAVLLCDPEDMSASIVKANELLKGFEYNQGLRYAEFKTGDKVAAYGLTALIAGGVAVAAAKTGLLAKLGILLAKFAKPIIIGVVAIGAAIGSIFRRRSA